MTRPLLVLMVCRLHIPARSPVLHLLALDRLCKPRPRRPVDPPLVRRPPLPAALRLRRALPLPVSPASPVRLASRARLVHRRQCLRQPLMALLPKLRPVRPPRLMRPLVRRRSPRHRRPRPTRHQALLREETLAR